MVAYDHRRRSKNIEHFGLMLSSGIFEPNKNIFSPKMV